MSMGKMKPDPSPPLSRPGTGINTTSKPQLRHMDSPERDKSPQIDLRFSTTGALDVMTNHLPTVVAPDVEQVLEEENEVLPPPSRISSTHQLGMRSNSSVSSPASTSASPSLLSPPEPTSRAVKRRSFLPIDINGPGSLNIPIPDNSHFVPGVAATNGEEGAESNDPSIGSPEERREPTPSQHMYSADLERKEEERARESYTRALRSVMAYLKDMNDLGLSQSGAALSRESGRSRRPTMVLDIPGGGREVSMTLSGTTAASSTEALRTLSVATTDSTGFNEERKIKDDKSKRTMVAKEILITERTYVKGLQELMDIYIKPACANVTVLSGVSSIKESVVPVPERKIVFGAVNALISFHKESFLPSLEKAVAPLMKPTADKEDVDGQLSLSVAISVGEIFWKYAAFMRMYSTYINNFDSAVQRVKYWSASSSNNTLSPSSSSSQLASMGLAMSGMANPAAAPDAVASAGAPSLSSGQRKRIRQYLKRSRLNPQHSQLNLESYLLLPIQQIPRYRLLLEDLRRSTPLPYDYMEDQLDWALNEISQLANNMNEGKREAEARRKLVTWQSRIRGKFPSPLVQPHRRLIMDGPLMLTRVVRKAVVSFEAINAQGDACTVDVDCLAPELTPRPLLGILCNDLLVLCRDPSEGRDPKSHVDLWAVLRMQTLPQPASIVHGNALCLVDNKAILYFDAPSASDALNWYRAINLHIPASKS